MAQPVPAWDHHRGTARRARLHTTLSTSSVAPTEGIGPHLGVDHQWRNRSDGDDEAVGAAGGNKEQLRLDGAEVGLQARTGIKPPKDTAALEVLSSPVTTSMLSTSSPTRCSARIMGSATGPSEAGRRRHIRVPTAASPTSGSLATVPPQHRLPRPLRVC